MAETITPYAFARTRCPCGPDSRVGGLPECHPAGDCPELGAPGGLLCDACANAVWAILDEPAGITFGRSGRTGTRAEPGPVDPERQKRHAAAVAYVKAYSGTWGLPLDIRADPRWGTKWLRLSDRQVDALLAGQARDEERARQAAEAAVDPRQTAAREYLRADVDRWRRDANRGYTFMLDMADRVIDRPLTPNQLAAVERNMARDAERVAAPQRPQDAPHAPTGLPDGPAAVGAYQSPDGRVWRVVLAVHGSGRPYARIWEPETGTWAMDRGAVRRIDPAWRMSREQAESFGALYGICAICGRTLTDPVSIAAGIGPICAGRQWGGEED